MALLTPNPGLIFWMIVVFLLLVYILSKYAWKPILKGLKDREYEIQSALDLAEKTKADMLKLRSDNERLIAEANAARDGILKDAKEASDQLIAAAKDKATAEGNRMIENAKEVIRSEQQAALSKIKKEVASLSVDIAEKVLQRELKDEPAQIEYVESLVSGQKNLN